ncbi:MAG: hypothetical protein M1827_003985 [Pycnora praestabilis]|nr:MAG: hypothetical protein M1827_003985 [Pycnora praestabilis]
MAALRAAKKELRYVIRKTLSDVSTESISSQSQKALDVLIMLPEYQRARSISVYLSMPTGEISTASIVYDALKQDKTVFVPYTYKVSESIPGEPASVMDMVSLHSIEDFESLKADSWGIPTPSKESLHARRKCMGLEGIASNEMDKVQEKEGLDLIIMPGMAFDVGLRRLGHGKGFYDFFLRRYEDRRGVGGLLKKPFLVGLGLKEQLLPDDKSVPTDSTDWPLDGLIIGDGRFLVLKNS